MAEYLLGELSEEDRARCEERLFTDDAWFDKLLETEERLIEDYLEGGLSPQERERFERHYLASPSRRERVELARELLTAGRRRRRFEVARAGWPVAAGIVLLAGLLWAGLEVRHLRGELGRMKTERAEMESRLARQPQAAPPVSVLLTSGLRRDAAGLQRLILPPGAPVRLQLDVQSDERFTGFRVAIAAVEGGEVWSQELPGGTPPVVELPAQVLSERDYVVRLRGRIRDGPYQDAGSFPFRVLRR